MTNISNSHDIAEIGLYQAQELLNYIFKAIAGHGTPITTKQISACIEVVQEKLAAVVEYIDSNELAALIPAGGDHAA